MAAFAVSGGGGRFFGMGHPVRLAADPFSGSVKSAGWQKTFAFEEFSV
jgi:hypothetical protein